MLYRRFGGRKNGWCVLFQCWTSVQLVPALGTLNAASDASSAECYGLVKIISAGGLFK